jgi:KDO2-lipid IV(A) lauroyltransferase
MKFTDRLNYYLISLLLGALALLPLRLLYVISDFLKWLLYDVIRYRRKVVEENLRTAFPDKDEKWVATTGRKFYGWLVDYFMETVKLASFSEEDMKRRLIVKNPEVINRTMNAGRNVVLYLGHYCNWEWVSSLPIFFNDDAVCCQVYHPLHNKGMDRYFYKLRTRFRAKNIAMDDIMRRLIEYKRAGKCTITGFIADQAPGLNVHLWLDFLNHETGVYTGPERIARFLDANCFYARMERPKRGYYTLEFVPVTESPKKEEQFEVTRKYFRLLENNISDHPQYWLWSHRRWKRSRADFDAYWGDDATRQLSHL